MTTTIQQPYGTGVTRSNIERALQPTRQSDRSTSCLTVKKPSSNQPRLRNWFRRLRTQHCQLQQSIDALRRELEGSLVAFADIRQRLAWLLSAPCHHRARESDLIYVAYCEAFRTDLGRHILEAKPPASE